MFIDFACCASNTRQSKLFFTIFLHTSKFILFCVFKTYNAWNKALFGELCPASIFQSFIQRTKLPLCDHRTPLSQKYPLFVWPYLAIIQSFHYSWLEFVPSASYFSLPSPLFANLMRKNAWCIFRDFTSQFIYLKILCIKNKREGGFNSLCSSG